MTRLVTWNKDEFKNGIDLLETMLFKMLFKHKYTFVPAQTSIKLKQWEHKAMSYIFLLL